MRLKSTADRYGGVAIAIHWISAVLIVVLMASGFRAAAMTDLAAKAAILRVHAPLGLAILVLTLARIVWWRFDYRPPPAADIARAQHFAARAVHTLFYVVIIFMAATGIGMLVLSGAGAILFSSAAGPLPDFWRYQPRLEHWIGTRLMLGLLALHVGAATYHHLIVRDGLMRRILPGRS